MEEVDTFEAVAIVGEVRVLYFQHGECTWLVGQRASKDVSARLDRIQGIG